MAVYPLNIHWLTHRYRGLAPSHFGCTARPLLYSP